MHKSKTAEPILLKLEREREEGRRGKEGRKKGRGKKGNAKYKNFNLGGGQDILKSLTVRKHSSTQR